MADPPRSTILIVDDEVVNRLLLRAMLGEEFALVEASSGDEATAALQRERIDLVLLDVMLPGESGYDICRRLKTQSPLPLPILLVTALNDQDSRNEGLEAGADDFLVKPVNRRELRLRVRTFLGLREQQAAARKKFDDLSRLQAAKDDLVSMLVHDLRTPLTGIVAHLHLVGEELPRDSPARVDLQQAVLSSERIIAVLEEALQVRLLEDSRLSVSRAPVRLAALVEETIAALDGVARRKRVAIQLDVPPELEAAIDGQLVRRSLENLLSNALKYTPPGGSIDISGRAQGGHLDLEIADRGPGVPDAFKDSLFEKFGSVEAQRGGARKGFGLGLYLVKLVALAHEGVISVADRAGGGALFRLRLAI